MGTPKAKNTDGKLIKKQKKRIDELIAESQQLRMSILNIRQMYEGSIGEKTQLLNQLRSTNQILVSAVVGARGKTITVAAKVLDTIDKYAGIDTKSVDGNLILTAITMVEAEKMQEEIDEA